MNFLALRIITILKVLWNKLQYQFSLNLSLLVSYFFFFFSFLYDLISIKDGSGKHWETPFINLENVILFEFINITLMRWTNFEQKFCRLSFYIYSDFKNRNSAADTANYFRTWRWMSNLKRNAVLKKLLKFLLHL